MLDGAGSFLLEATEDLRVSGNLMYNVTHLLIAHAVPAFPLPENRQML